MFKIECMNLKEFLTKNKKGLLFIHKSFVGNEEDKAEFKFITWSISVFKI